MQSSQGGRACQVRGLDDPGSDGSIGAVLCLQGRGARKARVMALADVEESKQFQPAGINDSCVRR